MLDNNRIFEEKKFYIFSTNEWSQPVCDTATTIEKSVTKNTSKILIFDDTSKMFEWIEFHLFV